MNKKFIILKNRENAFKNAVISNLKDGKHLVKLKNGNVEYYLNSELHREDGPARILRDGMEEYWQHGKLHNDNGPAKRWSFGGLEYWVNGERHRENGPAMIYLENRGSYYNNGILIEHIKVL